MPPGLKAKRPYAFIREGFWRGYGYVNTARANKDLWGWIVKKDERIHGTTREKINVRFKREQPLLNRLPNQVFDTSYRIYRKVHKDCTVHFEGNRYVLPHRLVGKQVILRLKDDQIRIFENDHLVIVYDLPDTKGNLVQDKRFYAALKKDRDMNRRKYNHIRKKARAKFTVSPTASKYDMDVEIRSILEYEQFIPEVAI